MVGGNLGAAREMAVVRKQKGQWEAWNFMLLMVGAQAYKMIPRTGKARRGFWSGFYELWIGRYFEITKKRQYCMDLGSLCIISICSFYWIM